VESSLGEITESYSPICLDLVPAGILAFATFISSPQRGRKSHGWRRSPLDECGFRITLVILILTLLSILAVFPPNVPAERLAFSGRRF